MTRSINDKFDKIYNSEKINEYCATNAGVLPKDWQSKKISEIADQLIETAGESVYETVSISAGIGFVNQAKKFGKELSGKQYQKYIVLHKGDFSYNKGNSNLYPQGCIYRLNDRETAAVPNVFESFRIKDGNTDYYEQLFASGFLNRQLYSRINRGVRDDGLLNLKGSDFYSCEVPVPSILEQQKIAQIFLRCDKMIKLKEELIEEENKLKKWLMDQLLVPNGCIQLVQYNESWEKKKISEIAKVFSGGTPKSSEKQYYSDKEIPFIRSGEIGQEFTELFISKLGLSESSAKMVEVGDLLYALYGANSGECAISKINGAINQAILCIRSDQINIKFLFYILSWKKDDIVSKYLQGGQGNLSAEIIKKVEVQFPPEELQMKIVDILSTEDRKISLLMQEVENWKQKKKSLMQLLLTGIVRVNV